MATFLSVKDVLNVQVSCFVNYNTPSNPKPINLYTWLTNTKYQSRVDTIRQTTDKAKRDELKATLPAITPSGLFTYRQAASLLPDGHSRLIQFDIDFADNKQIRNYANLKDQLIKLRFVAYCGLSVSGKGYWGLVPIAYPERHGQHFDALRRVFAHYGIKLDDKPRNVASLRGYSYDAEGYFAKEVILFELCDEPLPPPVRTYDSSQFADADDGKLLTRIVRMVEEAGEGNRHGMLLKAARLAGGYVGAGRLDEDTAVCALETVASNWHNLIPSQKTIRDGIKYGEAAPIYPEERTTPLNVKSKTSTRPTYKTYKSPVESEPTTDEINHGLDERIEYTVDVEVIESNLTDVVEPESAIIPTLTIPSQAEKIEQPPLAGPAPFRLPRLLLNYWSLFVRPPFYWPKIATYKALLRCLESDEPEPTASTIVEQLVNPGVTLKPDESQLERLEVEPWRDYPKAWDEPSPPDALTQIRVIDVVQKKTFHQWQQADRYHSQLGLASLPPKQHDTN